MHWKLRNSSKQALLLTMLAGSAALLGGCQSEAFMADDIYKPQLVQDRYPIRVAKTPMKLEVASYKGGLQAQQIAAVSNFARSASMAGTSAVSIRRPSGGGNAAASARQIYDILIQNGIPPERISQGTYHGSGKSPVMISFTRAVAVTKECGDWSQDLGQPTNQAYPDLGCSVQNNTAAMVQNPNDLKQPATVAPVHAAQRIDVKQLLN